MSKRHLQLSILALGALLAVGTAVAYFTTQASSQSLVVSTGSLAIEMDSFSQTELSNIIPGDTESIEWRVTNTGTAPVNMKGRIENIWSDASLIDGVKITKIEAMKDTQWTVLAENTEGISGEFFYSLSGADADLFELLPAEELPMRLSLEFDAEVGDEYQVQTSELMVHLAAKQLGETPWPEVY